MSVEEYEQEFDKLSRFAPELVATEAARTKRFIHGLKSGLQGMVHALDLKTYVAALQVSFLGHVVSKEGVSVDPAKVEAVTSCARLTTVSEVRNFLGLTGYYRRFVKDFSRIAAPLTKLTRKGVTFVWNKACENSFQDLKQRLVSAPVLTVPNGSGGFVIYTDASKKGLGCVLMQQGRLVAYTSRQLKKHK
ncbi:uncharacterized mitochondrial protein AtMg00860-like [Benincasa hispida]|uniref:uncharacterized mitochondrial protein AtMg00860-like n=1 Tax=Benincasa hispida TaxID=102211 RepID=UPI0018FF9480|nr:uncharacterized mitochondrial protein AtMg00860-like [Benincasa hispida]